MYSKLKNSLSSYGIVIAGLTAVVLVTALSGLAHYNQELKIQQNALPPQAMSSPKALTSAGAPAQNTGSQGSAPSDPGSGQNTPNNQITSTSKTVNTSSSASQTAVSANNAATISVSLSINGAYKGSVGLSVGSSQCDVLVQALVKGFISSLDMRYSSQYKTQAVYAIDGIGDPGSVWWTYKVNGSSPPYGCGAMTARNGDSVNWLYVKN